MAHPGEGARQGNRAPSQFVPTNDRYITLLPTTGLQTLPRSVQSVRRQIELDTEIRRLEREQTFRELEYYVRRIQRFHQAHPQPQDSPQPQAYPQPQPWVHPEPWAYPQPWAYLQPQAQLQSQPNSSFSSFSSFSDQSTSREANPLAPIAAIYRLLRLLRRGPDGDFRPTLGDTNGSYGWPGYTGVETFPSIEFLEKGGFNMIWLLTTNGLDDRPRRMVFRVPIDGLDGGPGIKASLVNEVATLRYIRKHVPSIPVPQVYAFDASDTLIGVPFVAMEFIPGNTLRYMWPRYSEKERELACDNLASVVMAKIFTEFKKIGGITLEGEGRIGPAVEYSRFSDPERKEQYTNESYDIGPYDSINDYVLASYDKELKYYTSISTVKDGKPLTREIIKYVDFINTLMEARMAFARSEKANSIEPFVLIHGDMHGSNILMNGTSIAGVLDWEFAGSYPLSDMLRRGFGCQGAPWERRVKDIVLERVGEWKMKMLESYEEPAWAKVRGLTVPVSPNGEIAVYETI